MAVHLNSVTFDASDVAKLSAFWATVAGAEAVSPSPYVAIIESDNLPRLMFIQSDEHKTSKNRCHLDLHVDTDAEVSGETERLVAAGATEVGRYREYGVSWVTMLDPEGNEFCLGTPIVDD